MYAMSHPPMAPLNGGGIGNGLIDGSGTINPAALNSSVLSAPVSSVASHPNQSPRGVKRSRSPDIYGEPQSTERGGDDDDSKPRKRGRPPKITKVGESPRSSVQMPSTSSQSVAPSSATGVAAAPVQTPQLQPQPLPPQVSPTQASPTKSTPTKGSVIKALPTVRDHTTDQLNPEGDEYIPREYDEAGEKKVSAMGYPLDGREYRCRTFTVPNRGEKLFMLATECARVLGYRDSYLLFNKNRSLYKIIATQAEKDDLIHQEILPYSYRSRQIAIVTARSMFRQFGSRLIQGGRRVRDDYWESKARKQGFTEEDAAGEKRPGAAKQREAAAAEANNTHALTALPHGDIIYSNGPVHLDGPHLGPFNPVTGAPLPMISLAPTDDLRPRDYGNVQRPRHEMSGQPYQDRSQPSTGHEILGQAVATAEFNKSLGQQRASRAKYLDDVWKRPHDQPPLAPAERQGTVESGTMPPVSQAVPSPQMNSSNAVTGVGQPSMLSHQSHSTTPQMMTPQAYPSQSHVTNPIAQSPIRAIHTPLRPDQMHHRSPSLGMAAQGQPAAYGYPQNQMWSHQPQPQPSPLSQHHSIPQYAQHPQQPSTHPQQSPLHAPPQLHHPQQGSAGMHGGQMPYQPMSSMGAAAGYSGMARNPYQQNPSAAQQFMHQSAAAQQPGIPGWAGPPQQQGWQNF